MQGRQRRQQVGEAFTLYQDVRTQALRSLFGIARKGRIAAGYDADFTLVDMKRPPEWR